MHCLLELRIRFSTLMELEPWHSRLWIHNSECQGSSPIQIWKFEIYRRTEVKFMQKRDRSSSLIDTYSDLILQFL